MRRLTRPLPAAMKAKLRDGARHGELAITGYRKVLADLRRVGDCDTLVKEVERLMSEVIGLVRDCRSTLAASEEAAAAKILNTWAAADERRF